MNNALLDEYKSTDSMSGAIRLEKSRENSSILILNTFDKRKECLYAEDARH